MLSLSSISKSYGARTLFEDVSFQLNPGERLGLVGPNGAGKSTFFSLILGKEAADEGEIVLQRGVRLGYLPQESVPPSDETVLEIAMAISPEMTRIQRILRRHEFAEQHHDLTPEDETEYTEAQGLFVELGGYQLEPKAKRILSGLAFRESDWNRPARELSGGWIMRAHLARLLVMEPDLLMLDEPTNHLDLESLRWFQNDLQNYRGSILVISHDREFLNLLCNGIVDIRHGKLSRYRGNYDAYLQERKARDEQHLAAYRNQQREIEHLQRFADRFRAKASKASQAQNKLKQIERMEKIQAPEAASRTLNFRFPQPPRSGQKVITLKEIHQSYGKIPVYEGMDFASERGDRTVLVGPNGAGKSTLLKILADVVPFQKGTRDLGHQVSVGYFAQHRVENLDLQQTVLAEVMSGAQGVGEQQARTLLGCFLFRGDDVFKRVAVLSGGEKSRLALLKLLLNPPNLLLMDEPTTHLDIPSIDALIQALESFQGTLIFISHDVYFIRRIAKKVLHIHAGQLTWYAGGYDYYLDKSKAKDAREALTSGQIAPPLSDARADTRLNTKTPLPSETSTSKPIRQRKSKEQKRREAEERQARARQQGQKQDSLKEIEAQITSLEARQLKLTQELENPKNYEPGANPAPLSRELEQVTESLQQLFGKWEQASQRSQKSE